MKNRRTFKKKLERPRTFPNTFFDPYGIRTPLELITCSRYYGTFVNNKQNIDNSIFMRLLRLFLFETRVWYLFLALSDSWLSIPTTWNKKNQKTTHRKTFQKKGIEKTPPYLPFSRPHQQHNPPGNSNSYLTNFILLNISMNIWFKCIGTWDIEGQKSVSN